jgi:hypothetical protein
MTMNNHECQQWIDTHQVLYAEGLLNDWKRKRIEKIPGWRWDASHVTETFRKA